VTRWLVRRIAAATVTVVIAITILIVLVRLLPGDPLATILGDRAADPDTVRALSATWGTDRTIIQTITTFFAGLVHGDLGMSLSLQQPVTTVLRERIGPTVLLGSLTLLADFTVGLVLGVWAALRADRLGARMLNAATIVGYTIPSFVIGTALVWVFAVHLGWFPPAGFADVLLADDASKWEWLGDRLHHLALPLVAMIVTTIAVPLRQQRSAVLAVARQPWVLAARARGVSPARVAWRHCWRPALTPIVTLLGLWLPMLVAGAIFVEVVFNWPGMGLLLAHATAVRDFPLVIGAGAVIIVLIQGGSLLADVLYHVVDPGQQGS
jgi:ABC-type dipeptide/oligopeptide/nickel transport system permease component